MNDIAEDHKAISVVLPTKDRLHYLQESVATFLTFPEVGQIVVVIDGATDGTREYLSVEAERESRITVHDNGRNRGIPYAKNRGIERATCPYLFIAEDDLDIEDGFFSTLLDHLRRTGADFIAPRNIFRAQDESFEDARARKDADSWSAPVDARRIAVDTGAFLEDDTFQLLCGNPMLGRSEAFRSVPFDERIRNNSWREESDFQLAVQERGFKLSVCPHAVSYNLVIEGDQGGSHSKGRLRRVAWQFRNNWIFLTKHEDFLRANFGMRDRYSQMARFVVLALAQVALEVLVQAKQRYLTERPLLPASLRR